MPKVNKRSKFNQMFDEPYRFSDGSYILSRELFPTLEEARREYNEWRGEPKDAEPDRQIGEGYVRYGFYPEELREELSSPRGWICQDRYTRGAKDVWVIA